MAGVAASVGVSKDALDALAGVVARKADANAIPAPSDVSPQPIKDTPAAGMSSPYARADHTHASMGRKQRITGVNTATYIWTYPTPFAAGIIPVCNGIVEDPANVATDSYNVQIVGVPTNLSCQFRIIRQSSGLLSLLLGALALNPTPGNINLHCRADAP